MGDRANICFRNDNGGEIWMYTHWGGSELPQTLQDALRRGCSRWNDPPYLARIIFSEMIKDDVDGTTGFGLSTSIGDNEHQVIYVDAQYQEVRIGSRRWTFSEYIAADLSLLSY